MGEEVWFRSHERQLQGLEQASPLNGRRMRIEYIARKKMPTAAPGEAAAPGSWTHRILREVFAKEVGLETSRDADFLQGTSDWKPPANGGGSIEVRSEALAVTDDDGFHLVDPC